MSPLALNTSVNQQQQVCQSAGDPIADWKYEMRREAQEILPGLFVGPYQASKDYATLQRQGITHVVCIFENRERHLVKPRFADRGIQYLSLEVRDSQDQNLIRLFPQYVIKANLMCPSKSPKICRYPPHFRAKQFIDLALANSGRVLVHCGDGISRSPAIVCATPTQIHNLMSR